MCCRPGRRHQTPQGGEAFRSENIGGSFYRHRKGAKVSITIWRWLMKSIAT